MQTKNQQRQIISHRLSSMTAGELAGKSDAACKIFLEGDLYSKSKVIMAYIAITGEADPSMIIKQAFADCKLVAVPLIDWERKVINPVLLTSLTEGLKKNKYGILEPQERQFIDPCSISAVIVPGLGFDLHGNRLGRGGGYYDKFLANDGLKAIKCGFALDCQILDKITTTPTDISLEALITPSRLHLFK